MRQFRNIKSVLLIAVILILQSCSNTDERHIGEWKGVDNAGTLSLILDKTNHAVFVQGNQVLGGKDFKVKGIKAECKYEIDYSKSPIWLDLVIYEEGETQESGRFKGIVRFITDKKIVYRINFTGERFDTFDPEDTKNTVVFDKVEN
jgi:hypothetical protein